MYAFGVCTSLAPNFSSQPEGDRARKKDGANSGDSKNVGFYDDIPHRTKVEETLEVEESIWQARTDTMCCNLDVLHTHFAMSLPTGALRPRLSARHAAARLCMARRMTSMQRVCHHNDLVKTHVCLDEAPTLLAAPYLLQGQRCH